MIGFHFQNSPNDWPLSVAKLPGNAMVKLLFGVERARESKVANPSVKTWYRWVGDQPLPYDNFEQHCRDWLNNFIDGTFRREAEHVDYIQGYNETLANSQPQEERDRWIALHTAMARVWYEEYRQEPSLEHIRIILCETAIGNDIPWQIAEAAQRYDALLGYHPYVVCRVGNLSTGGALSDTPFGIRHDAPRARFQNGGIYCMKKTILATHSGVMHDDFLYAANVVNRPDYVSPHDARWYSLRWATMDAEYVARDIHVDWAFGEGGPVLDASEDWSGWLDPLGGWENDDCLGSDLEKYKAVLDYWLQNTFQTLAYKEGRIKGLQLFTSGAPGGSGGQWGNFDLIGDDMQQIAEFSGNYDYPVTGEPPTEPPVEPPTDWQAELWAESIALQTIQLNPSAALQAAIFNDGYVPVESEFWHTIGDIQYAAQAAETLDSGRRRVYYTTVPDWGDVRWFTEGSDVPAEIVDIVDLLPTHATKMYDTRSLDSITDLIIHHTVSSDERTSAQIATYHVSKGWPGVGYHFIIGADGTIEQVNRLETVSYHASAANGYSVGIALKGDFTTEHPTDAQLESARWLVNWLGDEALDNVEIVYGHKEAAGAATACPGDSWDEWKNEVI